MDDPMAQDDSSRKTSRQQADAGYRKIPLRAQAGVGRAQRKCVQNETTLQLWTQKTHRRLVHFGASVLVPLSSLSCSSSSCSAVSVSASSSVRLVKQI